ncbi:hypothetical protein ACFL6D_04305, partial [Spirochaetota bacterium]
KAYTIKEKRRNVLTEINDYNFVDEEYYDDEEGGGRKPYNTEELKEKHTEQNIDFSLHYFSLYVEFLIKIF